MKDLCIKRTSVSGFSIFGVLLGKGMLDVKAVLDKLKEAGRDPDVLLEQFMGKKDSEEETLEEEERWIREGIGFLRTVL